MRLTLATALVLGLTAPAHAGDDSGKFAIDGVGGAPCSQYLEAAKDKKGRRYAVYAGWVGGYVTGHNRLLEQTFDLTPWQAVEVLLLQTSSYCNANPDAHFEAALAELIRFLEPKRMEVAGELIPFEADGKSVMIYRSVLDDTAAALTARGFTHDGTDAGISSAIKKMQEEFKVPVNGLPDVNVLARLFLN